MRKTIDLTEQNIADVTEYQQKNQIKNFSAAIRSIIENLNGCSCGDSAEIPDDKFALIGDVLVEIGKKLDEQDEKLGLLTVHLAPKSAGEVKA